jgi:excisionase family DNA binding protein
MHAELPDLITVREATQEFGLSRATLYRLLREGRLRRYGRQLGQGKGGPKTYVDRAEVKRLLRVRVVK